MNGNVETMQEWWENWLQGDTMKQRTTTKSSCTRPRAFEKSAIKRTFEGSTRSPLHVLDVIKQEIEIVTRATRFPILPQ
jgi:hypothetical protein